MTRVALVSNPLKTQAEPGGTDALLAAVGDTARDAGWDEVLHLETTEDDPGQGMAAEALSKGVGLVLVAGGDGTVRAVATGLAGSGVPLAILPIGTGNLLVRNLELSRDVATALADSVTGTDRALDLGRILGVDPEANECFAVMAGMGFDAAMMADAPEGLKERVGWLSYVVSGARHLRGRRFRVRLRIDGGTELQRSARGVLVGNVGRLQGGLELLPDAEPDSGLLDVAVLGPRHLRDWAVLAWYVLTRRQERAGHRLETFTGRRVEVVADREQPRQLDGDVITASRTLTAEVQPGVLRLRVPRKPTDDGAAKPTVTATTGATPER